MTGDTTEPRTATYVYAVVARGADVPDGLTPVGDRDGELSLLDHRDLAAVISDVSVDEPLGRRKDLMAHERVVNAIAEHATVLPMRFGGVVSDDQAVVDELLDENHDYFAWALDQLDGCVQFVLSGRYDEDLLLRGILGETSEIAELSESLRGQDEDATYYDRIRLGEMISTQVERRRAEDAAIVEERLTPFAVAVTTKEATGQDGAVNLSLLVRRDGRTEFEKVVDELGDDFGDRITLRLVGPVAPFDFLPEPAEPDGS